MMKAHILDHSSVALSGMNLIEASAGTGKTYAIASLYVRLLVERGLRPEEILVVTYTEAATKELHSRVRRRIREALDAMRGGDTEDAFLAGLHDRALESGKLHEAAVLLEAALAEFDTAAIFTIHGFCLRALQDHAFESGALYDTELVTDQSALAGEVVDDFWRERFFGDADRLLGYALLRKYSPGYLMDFLKSLQLSERDDVVPVYGEAEIARIEAACSEAFGEVCRLWRDDKEALSALLRTDKALSRAENAYRPDRVEPLLAGMESFIAAGNPFGLFDGFEKMTASGISSGTKSSGTAPAHSIFEACERLKALVDERLLAMKSELVAFYRKRLPERKREANLRFFDDLLADLYHALADGPGAVALAEALRNRYRAALIDEFQDTDPVQYEIFRRIYADSDAPLFLIGDPKQAIYSFRGADIFAYLQAAADVGGERRFTLNSNWRSSPKLLDGFNLLFDSERTPFVFDSIPSPPLVPGRSLPEASEPGEPPLEICLLEGVEDDGSLKSGESERFAAGACASMVVEAITGGTEAGGIAVIVRTHRQSRMMQGALRDRGIFSVMRSDESVFASAEAEEVRILISALADPGREPLVRAALVTPLFGLNGNDIALLNNDETAWVEWLQRFREYHGLWLEQGFMVAARELMRRERVRERLLGFVGSSGERALTNVLHCFELLHREAHQRALGMEGLVSWFSERVVSKEPGEDYQIRLESDEPAVRIVTAHVSKGLQYPVVFCPFQFGGAGGGSREVVLFHHDDGRMVRDFGSAEIDRHRLAAARESLAENLRLFYVALTRAEERCVFFTGRIIDGRAGKRQPLLSPPSWLLYVSDEARRNPQPVGVAQREIAALNAAAMAERLEVLADGSAGALRLRRMSCGDDLPEVALNCGAPPCQQLELRRFSSILDTDWRIASFTSFSRNSHMTFELPDRDESAQEQPLSAPAALPETDRSIFAFPRGAGAGILMHSIFETLDFASSSEGDIDEAAGKALDRYGFDREWLPCMSGMVREVLSTALLSPEGRFTLGGLQAGSWSTEFEFFFPLKRITSPRLAEVLSRHGIIPVGTDPVAAARALDFSPVKGMLMGFMDMVFEADGRFWLLDWKSNHLGNGLEEYRREKLGKAMTENLYQLQYLLYTVALDRFLSLRVPGYSYASHFGGVIYVFLRGVTVEGGEEYGFFRDLPSEVLIRELRELLVETEAGEVAL
jgi:exodeoxyribonuclease V beta subunit